MRISTVKFNTKNKPDFFKDLRERVNHYFIEKKITKYANFSMKIKTLVMLTLYFLPLIFLLTKSVSTPMMSYFMWILMGMGMSGIGLSVMHDANHGAYSKNAWVNKSLGFMLNFLGGYHINWIIQHNVLHHSYTNIHGYDEDIDNKLLRFSPHQKKRVLHRFQAYYAPFLYSLMSIYWLVSKDFEQLVRYHKKGLLSGQNLTLKKGFTYVIINKVWYIGLFLILPIILVEVPWWQTVLGFLTMHFITGLALALIFQPAHVVQETDFYKPDDQNNVENNWAIHQLHTTSNYAQRSIFFSWFIGGLNYQVEHHLFPHICHIHYKNISKIVKQTALEYGIDYHQHKTFAAALWSHFSLLNDLGTGNYDKKIATQV